MTEARGHTFGTIQAARGVAAVAVVLHHAGTLLSAPVFGGYTPMLGMFRFGHAGVDFFFVLSGFIIATVHVRDIGRPRALLSYAVKRLTRIYPIYWFATALAIALSELGLPGDPALTVGSIAPGTFLASLVLLPQHAPPLLDVAWTLEHEVMFYVIFAVLIANRRVGLAAFALWLCVIIASLRRAGSAALPWQPENLLFDFVGSPYHLEFFLGIGIAAFARRVPRVMPWPLLGVGLGGLACTGWMENSGHIDYLGYPSQALSGLFSAVALTGLVSGERLAQMRAPGAMVFLGEASYAIYLVHVPLMLACAVLFAMDGLVGSAPGWAFMIGYAVITIALGSLIHVAIERPMLSVLRRSLLNRGATSQRTSISYL